MPAYQNALVENAAMFSDTPVNNMTEWGEGGIHNQESRTRRFFSSPNPLYYVQKKDRQE